MWWCVESLPLVSTPVLLAVHALAWVLIGVLLLGLPHLLLAMLVAWAWNC